MRGIGVDISKVDALDKVLGTSRYGGDLSFPDLLHLQVVRSTKPHAKVLRVETGEALKVTGVERIFTTKDIPGKNRIGVIQKDQPVLASDRVRFIGDPIALVAAQTIEGAEEACQKVKVIYEELPFVKTPEEALQPFAPPIHEKGNLLIEFNLIKGNIQVGFKEAEVIIEETYTTTWVDHAYLEPDVGVAFWDEKERLTVICPTQNVHYDQREVASFLNLPLEKIRIIQPTTGGAFGGRLDVTLQCFLALAAFHLKRPVRLAYTPRRSLSGNL